MNVQPSSFNSAFGYNFILSMGEGIQTRASLKRYTSKLRVTYFEMYILLISFC